MFQRYPTLPHPNLLEAKDSNHYLLPPSELTQRNAQYITLPYFPAAAQLPPSLSKTAREFLSI